MTFCDSHNDILICGLAASGSLSQTLQPSQVFNAATTLSPTCGVWRTPHTLAPSKRLLPFGFRPRGHAKLPSPGSSASDPGQLRWWGAPPGLSRRPQASVTSPSNTLWERRLSRSPKSVEADLQRLKSVPAPPPLFAVPAAVNVFRVYPKVKVQFLPSPQEHMDTHLPPPRCTHTSTF